MKKLLSSLCTLGALALLWCICSALVTSGESDVPLQAPPLSQPCIATRQEALPLESAILLARRDGGDERLDNADSAVFLCVSQKSEARDNNGWLITGRTWHKTVYTVCPPEGVPG